VIEGDKPTTSVAPTPEEVEKVRADLERRRAMRLETEDRIDANSCSPD
jgi:hypothetical protein